MLFVVNQITQKLTSVLTKNLSRVEHEILSSAHRSREFAETKQGIFSLKTNANSITFFCWFLHKFFIYFSCINVFLCSLVWLHQEFYFLLLRECFMLSCYLIRIYQRFHEENLRKIIKMFKKMSPNFFCSVQMEFPIILVFPPTLFPPKWSQARIRKLFSIFYSIICFQLKKRSKYFMNEKLLMTWSFISVCFAEIQTGNVKYKFAWKCKKNNTLDWYFLLVNSSFCAIL